MDINTLKSIHSGTEMQQFFEGPKCCRVHIYADAKTDKKVRTESKKAGMSIVDYIMCYVLSFRISEMPERLTQALEKTDALLMGEGIATDYIKSEKGRVAMARAKKAEEIRTEQFHLRVTQECYDEIKKRAAQFSMSVSDYVVFVLTHYDITETSDKVDEINAKLDVLLEKKTGE